jgi:hypothetical protein
LEEAEKPDSKKVLQSPDGDLIDCVAAHLQPAFDHPRLRGHRRPLVTHLLPAHPAALLFSAF